MMTPPFPDKKYSVIYADPPYAYDANRLIRGNPELSYPTLTQKELCDLPISDISDNECLLFLWAVSPRLPQAIELGTIWGFDYKTVAFVWDKQLPLCGSYTLSQVEMCLVFKKGKIPKPRGKRNIRQFLSVKKGRHSEKPYEVRHRITEMFPHHEKIELFARERFDGWDAWGNEV